MTTLADKKVTNKSPASKPAQSRSCRWVFGVESIIQCFEQGIATPLSIQIGENSWCYLVELNDDGTYTMSHVRADNSGAEPYTVDLNRKSCTCPAAYYRSGECKHVSALRAALKWLEAQL